MALHQLIIKPGIYFITFTCVDWIPLIGITNSYSSIYSWFDTLASKGHFITAYVIMPNHLHMLLYFAGDQQSLNTIIGNGKRFLAYDIVKRLIQQKQEPLLLRLSHAVLPNERKRGKIHEVWKSAFDAKPCRTENFILQKLHYIHNNPCSLRWKLVDSPEKYSHGSASFYYVGRNGSYVVKDYREFLNFEESDESLS